MDNTQLLPSIYVNIHKNCPTWRFSPKSKSGCWHILRGKLVLYYIYMFF